ncbi:MAG: NRDE family protein [Candidatus Binatia bacterium]|nr:NRDE family protein [Candidatus Binatia bacterium]
MCTLAVYTDAWSDLPLVVAANRDEFFDRPAVPPEILGDGAAFGGRDLCAGGTWLAVGRSGLVVGVLNRRSEKAPDPSCLSRGTLCVALAETASLPEALALLRVQNPEEYNPFNLLIADQHHAHVAQNRGGKITIEQLTPGLHLLTNLDLNDIECERISRSTHRFAELVPLHAARPDRAKLVDELHLILADHQIALDDRKPTDQLCIHTPTYGTRSSSLVLMDDVGALSFLYAHGPPCRTAYGRVELPWTATSSAG